VRYEEGENTNLPVMDAQEKLTQAQVNYFDALYSYNMNKAQLEKAMGIPIEIDAAIYSSAVENGKNATKALEKSAVASSTILNEHGKVKKRSEDDIQPVRKSENVCSHLKSDISTCALKVLRQHPPTPCKAKAQIVTDEIGYS